MWLVPDDLLLRPAYLQVTTAQLSAAVDAGIPVCIDGIPVPPTKVENVLLLVAVGADLVASLSHYFASIESAVPGAMLYRFVALCGLLPGTNVMLPMLEYTLSSAE